MPQDPVKDGYTFVAWVSPDGSEWNFEEMTVEDDIVLKATWKCNHSFDHACDADCNVEGCGHIREIEHVYDDENDTTCNVAGCGHVRAS